MNGKSSTFLILVLAAVALGCFAVKSYYDYQVTMFKHEHGVDGANSAEAAQAATTAPAAAATVVPPLPVVSQAQAAPAPARDPEMEKVRLELETLREENKIAQQKLEAMRSGDGSANNDLARTGEAPQDAAEAEVEALRQQLVNAPAVAQVVECNWDFDLIFINGGKDRNLEEDETFAIRRGSDIVGFVKVEEVEATHAVTKLTSKNALTETSLKPEPGDDLIKWPLF